MKASICIVGLAIIAVTMALPQRSRDWPPRSTGPTFPRSKNPLGGYRFRRGAESLIDDESYKQPLADVELPFFNPLIDPATGLQSEWQDRHEADIPRMFEARNDEVAEEY